jgi:hypothetical protein
LGTALARFGRERDGPVLLGLSLAALLIWLAVRPDPWTDFSWAVFLLRDSLVLPLLALAWLLDRKLPSRAADPLLKLGQHSLIVYWVHVEIVYGRWLWRLRGTLTLLQGALVLSAVLAAMAALAYLVEWRPRARAAPAARVAA